VNDKSNHKNVIAKKNVNFVSHIFGAIIKWWDNSK